MEVKNSSEQLQKILSAISAVSNQQRKESYSLLKYEIHKVVLPHMGVPLTETIVISMVKNAPLVSLCGVRMMRLYDTRPESIYKSHYCNGVPAMFTS